MILSKYSGNLVGYLDYYAGIDKRISAVAGIAPSQRVRRECYWPDTSAVGYIRFCRAQGSAARIIKGAEASRHNLCFHLGNYDSSGGYLRYYEKGCLLDIRI